ncbi:ATP-binding protein [Kitasatospora sp. NPDC057940]|uniref:ATP-binding protein n=1 Tax=Kitasatospora sp. NPDC057940 TaxID=3346285 RepID=UPI0036DFA06A
MNYTDTATIPTLRSWDVEPDPEAVRPARQLIRHGAESWRVPLSDTALRDVELCADELLANAIEHVRKRCRVTVRWTGVRLRVEVTDRSPQPPVRSAADDMATGGRGLLLVEALTHSWGWYPAEEGKVVWFEAAPDQLATGGSRLAVPASATRVHARAGVAMTATPPSSRHEIRLIDSRSPHFFLLECWGIYDREQHEYLRVPGSSDRIRRFYTKSAAESQLRHSGTLTFEEEKCSA